MKIYTGYFAKLKWYELRGLYPFSIALYPPEFFKKLGYPTYHIFTPSKNLILDWKNNRISKEEYIEVYCRENLQDLDVTTVVDFLSSHSNHKDIILLCYEKPEFFCHRQIVSLWFNQNGIDCIEYRI